jgi:hypothetical protein
MINDIIQNITEKLVNGGVTPVYNAFDAVPVSNKDKGIFTVIEVESFESTTPIYSLFTVFTPFKAEISIKITAPENYSIAQLYEYYDKKAAPAINKFSSMNCWLSGISIKFDSNINRLVLTAKIPAAGMLKAERGSE